MQTLTAPSRLVQSRMQVCNLSTGSKQLLTKRFDFTAQFVSLQETQPLSLVPIEVCLCSSIFYSLMAPGDIYLYFLVKMHSMDVR